MKGYQRVLSYILVAITASCVTLTAVFLSGVTTRPNKLLELEQLLEDRFVGEVDLEAVEHAAAGAMVEAIGDRWSFYMTQEEFRDRMQQMTNSYVGVGMTVQENEEGYVDILRVEPGGPAEEAGILAGDVLTAVNGQDVRNQGVEATKTLVVGEEGTTVSLTLLREGRTLTLEVERRQVKVQVAKYAMLEGNVGLVTIVNFADRCCQETVAAIEALREQGATALIFDVRNNPGGYKHELVALLDYLLPEGPIFRSVYYDGTESVDESDASFLDMPMMVLANGNSYSAAELFTAALMEYDAAVFVGQPTTGKGRFQTSFQLYDGSAVNLSVGAYTTPKGGVDLTDVGLTPDVLVDLDEETAMEIYYGTVPPEEDPQIQKALELLTSGS